MTPIEVLRHQSDAYMVINADHIVYILAGASTMIKLVDVPQLMLTDTTVGDIMEQLKKDHPLIEALGRIEQSLDDIAAALEEDK
jgi:hypothetical protein